ncbi:MAG: hypothetical protein SPD11_12795 [Sphaerochaetaceae bacterium]|nr:hypothetical protein [Sphaerochaetaceae bacterium]
MAKDLQPNLKPWKYEESVSVGKKLVSMHRKITLELVRELYAANQALSQQGARSDLVPNDTKLMTFEQYLCAIGLAKKTAYRYLSIYLPEEDRLLTDEEIQERKEEAKRQLIELFKSIQGHVGDINWRPEGWTPSLELKYQEWLRCQRLISQVPDHAASWEQLGLFAPEYLDAIGQRIQTKTSGMGLIEFNNKCVAAKKIACTKVPVQEQMRICMIVEAALEDFQPEVRAEVAKFVSQQVLIDTTMKGETI